MFAQDGRAACRTARAVPPDVWAPVASGMACTRIFVGPQTARVYGSIGERRIVATFNRSGG